MSEARTAGVSVVAFAGGYRSAEQLGLADGTAVVADLRLVIDVLAALGSA